MFSLKCQCGFTKTAAATAEELIRLAVHGWLWWHVPLLMLSPARATPLAAPSLLPAVFAAGFVKETGTSIASNFDHGSSVGMMGAAELLLQPATFPHPLSMLPSQPARPTRRPTAPAFLLSTFCPSLCQD